MGLHLTLLVGPLTLLFLVPGMLWAQGDPAYELPPVKYSQSTPEGPVAQLIKRL